MKNLDWDVVVDGLAFPEGLRWHDDHLYFSDIFGGQVMRCVPGEPTESIATVPTRPSGLGFRPDGIMLVVSMRDSTLLEVTPAGTSVIADLSGLAGGDCNDMLVDARGRAYVGNFGYDLIGGADEGPAKLLMVDLDGSVRAVADDLWFPNGMILTPDGRTLLVAESAGERITAFTVSSDGSLSDRRVFSDVSGRRPDGITLDADGSVWAPSPKTGEILYIDANGVTQEILPAPTGTTQALMLGGPDGHTLFAACSPSPEEEEALRDRGAVIMSTRVDVPAAAEPEKLTS